MSHYTTGRNKSERPRRERDFYPTPYGLCLEATRVFFRDEFIPGTGLRVLDAGCADGRWGWAVRNYCGENTNLVGIDISDENTPSDYDVFKVMNFLDIDDSSNESFDIVIGNPPYSLADEFVKKSLDLVVPGGYVYFLLRLPFLEGRRRQLELYRKNQPKKVYVLTRRPSFFSTNGRKTVDSLSYAMFLWKKGFKGFPSIDWLYWEYHENDN